MTGQSGERSFFRIKPRQSKLLLKVFVESPKSCVRNPCVLNAYGVFFCVGTRENIFLPNFGC